MDRHLAASLDRWLTTPPEDRYSAGECECADECGCDDYDAELEAAEEAHAEYEAAQCFSCNHPRYHHGEECFGGATGSPCSCAEFVEAQND